MGIKTVVTTGEFVEKEVDKLIGESISPKGKCEKSYLVDKNKVIDDIKEWLEENITEVDIIGGETVVSKEVELLTKK
ncbi:cell wall-binding repeat-containing protein [Faecalimicrobium dakarense]|uniref:cell wall-binding repeat-containing protein n=1 Tax=Faecalimicrobium dakarense TaxID=1301100 RepID=UPI0004B394A9|nr:cell wall-binding repeat-containing protein [[Clostridium] dakarense]